MYEIAFVGVFVSVYMIVRPAIHKLFKMHKEEK